jgi:serine O-acetyltransferase
MFNSFFTFIDSILARDPAARSRIHVILLYPGVHAVAFYRLANLFWRGRFFLVAHMVSQTARFLTGIEIHPAATIGQRLFIDHGMGVVIGETVEIGHDVTLYQHVTLGGQANVKAKRHPTIGDHVVVGAGAQILGPITIGAYARIGANAVVVHDVGPSLTMVGVPAHAVGAEQ